MSSRQRPRVLRPHRDWLVVDFVLAAIALAFLAPAVIGIVMVTSGTVDLVALNHDCVSSRCYHAGTLTAKARTHLPNGGYGGLYDVGPAPDYCVLTMSLDVGTRQVAVAAPICKQLSAPSPIQAEIWHGRIVAVRTQAQTITAYFDPSNAVFAGLVRMIALVPFALFLALIEVDIAHHRPVWRVRHGLSLWRMWKPRQHRSL